MIRTARFRRVSAQIVVLYVKVVPMSNVSVPVAFDKASAVMDLPSFSPITCNRPASRAILTAAFRRG